MSDNKLISIVGYSLVPRSVGNIPGCEICIFRSPGARVSGFESDPILASVLDWQHDLTLLFIGGNDINDSCIPSKIASDIQEVVEIIHNRCNSCIALILIEHRDPPPNNRFNVTTTSYNRIANNINNRLKRSFKNKPYVKFLSVGAKPFQRGQTDGVHFDITTQAHLTEKLRNTIKRFIGRSPA